MGTATWWAGSMAYDGTRGSRGPRRWGVESPERPPARRRVVFPGRKGEPIEAVLSDAGAWSCPGLPVLDRVLNALYAPDAAKCDEEGWGRAEMIRAAAWLRGRVATDGEPTR